jgi:hypothetical protein
MNLAMNFSRFRSKYRGPVNPIAYFGMLGDIVVATGLYVLWKERKRRNAEKAGRLAEEEKLRNLYLIILL